MVCCSMAPEGRTAARVGRGRRAAIVAATAVLLMLAFTGTTALAGLPSIVPQPPEPLEDPIELVPDQPRAYVDLCPDSHPYLIRPLRWAILLKVGDEFRHVDSDGGSPSVRGLEVEFLPTAGGRAGVFSFKVHSSETNKKISVLWPREHCTKPAPPQCERIPGPGRKRSFRFQEPIFGLRSIRVIVRQNVKLTMNGEPVGTLVEFPIGTRDPVTVDGDAILQDDPSVSRYSVTPMVGEAEECDPLFVRLAVDSDGLARVASDEVAEAEQLVTVTNGRAGLSTLTLTVNGRSWTVPLGSGEERSLDISPALEAGAQNRVILVGRGDPGAEAQVTIWEGPSGGARPRREPAASAAAAAGVAWSSMTPWD